MIMAPSNSIILLGHICSLRNTKIAKIVSKEYDFWDGNAEVCSAQGIKSQKKECH